MIQKRKLHGIHKCSKLLEIFTCLFEMNKTYIRTKSELIYLESRNLIFFLSITDHLGSLLPTLNSSTPLYYQHDLGPHANLVLIPSLKPSRNLLTPTCLF